MRALVAICWLITLIATLPAAFLLASALTANAAPAQGAAAAVACGMVIVPYVFTRALEGMSKPNA